MRVLRRMGWSSIIIASGVPLITKIYRDQMIFRGLLHIFPLTGLYYFGIKQKKQTLQGNYTQSYIENYSNLICIKLTEKDLFLNQNGTAEETNVEQNQEEELKFVPLNTQNTSFDTEKDI